MGRKHIISSEDIKRLHEQGLHPYDIAESLGCSHITVRDRLKSLNIDWERKTVKKLTEDQEKLIIKKYKEENLGATTLGRTFGVNKKTIYRVLNSHGVGTRSVASRRKSTPKHKNTRITKIDLQVKDLSTKYSNLNQIAKIIGCSSCAVRYSMNKQDLYLIDTDKATKVRQKLTQNKGLGKGNRETPLDADLDHNAFYSFTEECCYWLGFMCADGCVYYHKTTDKKHRTPRLFLRLKESDIGHLLKLKAFLKTNNTITHQSHLAFNSPKLKYSCCLAWSSRKHATALGELGIRSHKEGRFVPVSLEKNKAYWRGLIDGDGCVYHPGKGCLYLSGPEVIIDAWIAYCEDLTGVMGCVKKRETDTTFTGTVRFKKEAKFIIKTLYEGSCVYLERKFNKARLWF